MEKSPLGLNDSITLAHAASLVGMTRQALYGAYQRGHLRGMRDEQRRIIWTTAGWLQEYLDSRHKHIRRNHC